MKSALVRRHPEACVLAGLALFGALLYLPGLGNHALWNPDEPRFGEGVRIMLRNGDFWTPRLNGEIYPNKPILYFVLGVLSSWLLGGLSETAVRLPSALAAIATVLAAYKLGSRLFESRRVGFLGAIVLATSQRFVWQAHWAQTDMLLTLWVTLALSGFHEIVAERKARAAPFLCLYVSVGLAVLTKGLAGLILPGLAGAAFIATRRNPRAIWTIRPIEGTIVFLAVTVPWFAHMTAAGGTGYLKEFFVHQHFTRFVSAFDHKHSVLFYLWSFPLDFLPWSLFVPAAAVSIRRSWKARDPARGPSSFLAVWFLAVFAFFTISSAKRGLYLLPLFPPAALLVGKTWDEAISSGKLGPWLKGPLFLFMITVLVFSTFGAIFGAACQYSMSFVSSETYLELRSIATWPARLAGTAAFTCMIGLCFWLESSWKTGRARHAFAAIAISMVTATLATILVAYPQMDRFKSIVPFASEIRKNAGPEDELRVYGYSLRFHINYYSGRERIPAIEKDEDLERYLASERRVFLITEEKKLDRFLESHPARLVTLARAPAGERPILLVANR